jgi:predicted TIM-barrel fold metal-dependent hydrolase
MGDVVQPDWMIRVKEDTFKSNFNIRSRELPEMLEEMDAHGVRRAVLLTNGTRPSPRAQEFVEAHPERFSLGLGGHNLLKPMPTLKALESFVASNPVAYITVGPSFWGDGRYPPTDSVYFPLYTKCCELDIPLCMNTGLPGPPIPGEVQNPIYLDRVCCYFPELKLSMIHGADPWWDTAIRLMIKYANLRLMTSAWSPKRLPESLLHFMRTRGQDRIIFASDSPVLSITRTVTEASVLDLPPDVLDNYLYGNAENFFFSRPGATGRGSKLGPATLGEKP